MSWQIIISGAYICHEYRFNHPFLHLYDAFDVCATAERDFCYQIVPLSIQYCGRGFCKVDDSKVITPTV